MQRTVVKVYAVLIALLAVMGMFVNEGYILGIMNADVALDWLRVSLALILLYAGFFSEEGRVLRASLWLAGGLYVGIGILGLADTRLWGLTPNGLTGFDIAFHLVAGLLAIGVVAKKEVEHGHEVHA